MLKVMFEAFRVHPHAAPLKRPQTLRYPQEALPSACTRTRPR